MREQEVPKKHYRDRIRDALDNAKLVRERLASAKKPSNATAAGTLGAAQRRLVAAHAALKELSANSKQNEQDLAKAIAEVEGSWTDYKNVTDYEDAAKKKALAKSRPPEPKYFVFVGKRLVETLIWPYLDKIKPHMTVVRAPTELDARGILAGKCVFDKTYEGVPFLKTPG